MASGAASILHTCIPCDKTFCGTKVIYQGQGQISRSHFSKILNIDHNLKGSDTVLMLHMHIPCGKIFFATN